MSGGAAGGGSAGGMPAGTSGGTSGGVGRTLGGTGARGARPGDAGPATWAFSGLSVREGLPGFSCGHTLRVGGGRRAECGRRGKWGNREESGAKGWSPNLHSQIAGAPPRPRSTAPTAPAAARCRRGAQWPATGRWPRGAGRPAFLACRSGAFRVGVLGGRRGGGERRRASRARISRAGDAAHAGRYKKRRPPALGAPSPRCSSRRVRHLAAHL